MSNEARKDCRFYAVLSAAMVVAMVGTFTPPVGELAESLLWAFFGLLGVDCCVLGIDVQGIIRELRLLKESKSGEVVQQ